MKGFINYFFCDQLFLVGTIFNRLSNKEYFLSKQLYLKSKLFLILYSFFFFSLSLIFIFFFKLSFFYTFCLYCFSTLSSLFFLSYLGLYGTFVINLFTLLIFWISLIIQLPYFFLYDNILLISLGK